MAYQFMWKLQQYNADVFHQQRLPLAVKALQSIVSA